jgi:hypothetical protein
MSLVWEKDGEGFYATVMDPAGEMLFRLAVETRRRPLDLRGPLAVAMRLPCTEPLRTRSGRRYDRSSAAGFEPATLLPQRPIGKPPP